MSSVIDFFTKRTEKAQADVEEDVTNVLIKEELPGTYRVMCLSEKCALEQQHFDVFGTMAPYGANGDGECTVVQRVLEHLRLCSPDKKGIKATKVMKHNELPVYNLKVSWVR